MATSSNIWILVNKMTRNEKLFYRRDYTHHRSTKNIPIHLKIFEILVKQREYDEIDLLKKLSPELNEKNISYTKHYLFNDICQALILLHSRNSVDAMLHNDVRMIKLFREKNMVEPAIKLCKKLLKAAEGNDNNLLYQQVMKEYRKILLYQMPGTNYDTLKNIFDISNEQLIRHTRLLEYESLYYKSLLLRRKSHFKLSEHENEKVELLLENHLVTNPPDDLTFLCSHYYKMTKATLLYLKGDEEAADISLENIESWHKHPYQIENESENYLEALFLFNYTGVYRKIYDKVERVMTEAAAFSLPNSISQHYSEAIQYLSLIRVYHKTAQFKKVANALEEIKKKINLLHSFLNDEMNRTLYLSIGISSFVMNQLEDAYYFIKTAILYFNDHTRQEQFSFAYLFLLIICLEKKDFLLFDHQYTNTYNYFYRYQKPLLFEKLILQALHRAIKPISHSEQQLIFSKLLVSLEANNDDLIQKNVFQFFNIPLWLKSKIANIPYMQMVENSHTS